MYFVPWLTPRPIAHRWGASAAGLGTLKRDAPARNLLFRIRFAGVGCADTVRGLRDKGNGQMTRHGFGLLAALCVLAGCVSDDGGPTVVGAADVGVTLDSGGAGGADGGALRPQCRNGIDDDGDGQVDGADPGCADRDDDDESDDPPPPECANGVDDDDDGQIDFPADPGCASRQDANEGDDPPLPVCSNGEDDDLDGLIDFPEDPGCGSLQDDDERDDGVTLPQCGDGIDNDNDGLLDLADPGCASPADPREADPEVPPACSNRLDDDGDGVVDFPAELGCSAAGDEDESDPAQPPACANGADDDGDGQVDYPVDPGCAGQGDRDEGDPVVTPACADGVDNDRDGATDYPEDQGCSSAADGSELGACGVVYDALELTEGRVIRGDSRRGSFESEGSCGGRGAPEVVFAYRLDHPVEALVVRTDLPETAVETTLYVRRACLDGDSELACVREPIDDGVAGNQLTLIRPTPGDFYIFLDGATGRGGDFALTVEEVPLAACLNGIDDDGDGRRDYPLDPGCARPEDRDETDPIVTPACANDEDDDMDGQVDYPLDPGCTSAADDDELDECGPGVRFEDYPVGQPSVLLDTSMGTNEFVGSCGGQGAAETVLRYVNPYNARLTFSTNHPETINNTLVYVRSACIDRNSELGCDAGADPRPGEVPVSKGSLRLDRVPPGDLFVVVDHGFGMGGAVRLSVEVERLPPGCSDEVDNDDDGRVDADDPGCESPEDEDERDPEAPPVCFDGIDQDGDGLIDFPFDPGCATKGDPDEADPAVPAACNNGLDDDEDGVTDFPADVGCFAAADPEEGGGRPACNNRIDDDMDGLVDWPLDPGCSAPGDLGEADDDPAPACFDELDNDRDGLVDFPFDPGCAGAGDRDETDPAVPAACSNGLDDDGDGVIDFPREPGCDAAGDDDETDPAFPPQCANGRDDDGNGRQDWPDDPGCRFAADAREVLDGPVPARCSDGVDNDDDGLVDLRDPGCEGARDDDEADLAEPPFCANGVDDDADGAIDWPADDGCAAQGDACEQTGFGLCEGVCEDLINDEANCGVCGRTCDAGVECIDGFCGGLFAFEGIQQNVPDADLGGWEVCHADRFGDRGANINGILAACDGEFVMYGCRQAGQPNWQLLAMGERDAVFQNTGDQNNNLNNHNGVDWYFSQSYSIGFVAPGTGVSRNSCDTANASSELRLCWHTSGGALSGGYRCGARTGLNGAQDWERVIWTSR